MPNRNGLDLETGERLHYRGALRDGDEIAVTDRRVLLVRADEVTSVPYTNVSEVTHEWIDWLLVIMSLALAAFGVYSVSENALVGLGLTAFGLWSVYRTYRDRDRIRIHTHSQAKPIDVYPEDVDRLYDELEPAIEAVREEPEPDEHGESGEPTS
ncbi:hypothetical protein SAMN05444422_106228 [Halobiforma haloterrestris]|uniref:Uncharacterized protein n=1 Tax=Natronobacterium haloterrestre TaxID=148448 RepID=A0A1I1I6J8_NATHA|nr:hypothetical protein [Halobiforma haloterrestris]SFC28840.1 hypothetical protein SAMN05444422_106228 [Halobiforma haloterrestris]